MSARAGRIRAVWMLTLLLATTACTHAGSAQRSGALEMPPGPYGWHGSVAPNSSITDGSTILEIARGPVRILSVTPKQSGAIADILGIDIRVLDHTTMEPFLMTPGFPAQKPADWAGAEGA